MSRPAPTVSVLRVVRQDAAVSAAARAPASAPGGRRGEGESTTGVVRAWLDLLLTPELGASCDPLAAYPPPRILRRHSPTHPRAYRRRPQAHLGWSVLNFLKIDPVRISLIICRAHILPPSSSPSTDMLPLPCLYTPQITAFPSAALSPYRYFASLALLDVFLFLRCAVHRQLLLPTLTTGTLGDLSNEFIISEAGSARCQAILNLR
ncbi:hypothetical protein C8J57DRAFT_1510432 [Mycena rebaudengoi]|nr:hypothetical protein C8J57DRAFT_1510432 [Mycena rebaudengoi]